MKENHNIFAKLSPDEYREVLGNVKHCILATDLALFFPNKARLTNILKEEAFSWDLPDHRYVYVVLQIFYQAINNKFKEEFYQILLTIFFFIYLDYDLLINNNRLLSQAICMTGSDLNSSSKPWPIQHRTSKVVYQEFHDQVS